MRTRNGEAGGGRRPEPSAAARLEARPTGFSAVFRGEDDQVYHGRCRSCLAFYGIRARLEADFYCLVCMCSVTVPVVVLERLAVATPHVAPLTLVSKPETPRPSRNGRKGRVGQAA